MSREENNTILDNFIKGTGSLEGYKIIGTPIELKPIGDNVEMFDENFLNKVINHLITTFYNPDLLYDGYYKHDINYNNFNTYRLYIMSIIYNHLDKPLIYFQDVFDRLKTHLKLNLYDDGSTYDFHERDSILYHEYNMIGLLTVIEILEKRLQMNLYVLIRHGILFMIPFINGNIEHIMFLNSKLQSDINHRYYGVKYSRELSNQTFFDKISNYDNYFRISI